jgi:hypothetical protein
MVGDRCSAELFSERHRDPLKAACAEDRDIWEIYANNFGPEGFDASINGYMSGPRNRTFVLFDGESAALITARGFAAPASTAAPRT